ncbi:nitroreductase family deazaflavin-dependent oxidoreductase [Microlunatus sp. Y2014]|uniref:nitroreductase family deazaflavin-dependent oxidoreductase n=1 Tax=Microlunatus sp. Y2014 TaxID=3418488 RepID=UPI003DA72C8A
MTTEREFVPPATGWVREQLATIDAAGDTAAVTLNGMRVIVMEMKGARSGKWRRVPVMRAEHDGRYAVVASHGGAPKHPAWYHNLVANPEIGLQDGTEVKPYRVRELAGDERATWWERAVAAFPPYGEYALKTDRVIPVLVAEPAAA